MTPEEWFVKALKDQQFWLDNPNAWIRFPGENDEHKEAIAYDRQNELMRHSWVRAFSEAMEQAWDEGAASVDIGGNCPDNPYAKKKEE